MFIGQEILIAFLTGMVVAAIIILIYDKIIATKIYDWEKEGDFNES